MIHENIVLPRTGVTLETFLTDNDSKVPNLRRPLVLLFPGGAYFFRAHCEAEPVALRLLSLGVQCVIVHYSVAPVRYPKALEEAAEAVAYAHEHAEEWLADSKKVAVMGFSAGGHAAGHIGIRWQDFGIESRPDAMILCYPVITSGEFAHRNSFENLLGDRYDELLDTVSLEKHVTDQTPATFLWHTWTDGSVPVENSLLFANALRQHGVPCEMHIYANGQHGLSLANEELYEKGSPLMHPECSNWIDMATRWLKEL